jgi:hypothetical protein
MEINAQALAQGMQNRDTRRLSSEGSTTPYRLGFQCGLGWIIESPASHDKQSCAESQLFQWKGRPLTPPGSPEKLTRIFGADPTK